MILTVDIGNSRIKWAYWHVDEIFVRAEIGYRQERSSDTFDNLLEKTMYLIHGENPQGSSSNEVNFEDKPSKVFALCVAGDGIKNALTAWVKQNWQLEVHFLETQKRYNNIINAYDEPGQYGVDRWAGIVAASQTYPENPVCVIDAGTAITIDLVKKGGQHLGGYILPSFTSMYHALLTDTANIGLVLDKEYTEQEVPNNTQDAINQGLHKLLQSGIRELCKYASDVLGESVQIILTGGYAKVILTYPDMPALKYEPDLVMKGLYNILQQQKLTAGN